MAEFIEPKAHRRKGPVLQMNVVGDEVFGDRSAVALFDAFPGPKTHVWFGGVHSEWEDGDLQYAKIFDFVAAQLQGPA